MRVVRERIAAVGLDQRGDLPHSSGTEIPIVSGSTDRVVALESAFHFHTRERFFREAWRVLRPSGLRFHTMKFILYAMSSVRKTISLPPAVAKRLDDEARRRKTSVSAIVTELVSRQPDRLPYAALIEDDEDLSMRIEDILARLGR